MTVSEPQGAAPQKKGMGPLGWVAIGCGVIVVLGLVVMVAAGMFVKKKVGEFQENPALAAAKMMVAVNPDLELVSTDEEAGTITVRNTKTGEEVTVDLEEAKEGRFTFKTAEGESTVDFDGGEQGGTMTVTGSQGEQVFRAGAGAPSDMPSWIPIYPGGSAQSSYSAQTAEGKSGVILVSSSDSADEVLAWYESRLQRDGFEVEKMTMASGGTTSGGTLSAQTDGETRVLSVVVTAQPEGTQAMVTYQEKQ